MKESRLQLCFIASTVCLFVGCSSFGKVDELLTLKKLSEEQESMKQDVAQTNKMFNELVLAIEEGRVGENNTKRSIKRLYGPPILTDQITRDSQSFEVWLYRHSTEFFGADKVYLYFDSSNKLTEWDYQKVKREARDG